MKKKLLLIVLAIFMGGIMEVNAQNQKENGKILIAYFSHSGNTRIVAQEIGKIVGGDFFEIKTIQPYPKDYNTATDQAKREQSAKMRPALVSQTNNPDSYDIIFLGYPIWWGTLPMAVFTFLESYDLSGKTIIPFCTHGGSALGNSVNDVKKLAPKATVREGLAIRGGDASIAQNNINAWLKRIGIRK